MKKIVLGKSKSQLSPLVDKMSFQGTVPLTIVNLPQK